MEKPKPKEGMRKFPCEVTTVRLVSFSFVPALKKLPTESTVTLGEEERQPMRRSNEYVGTLKEAAAGQTMSGDGVFKADFVYVGGDVDEGDPGNRRTRLAKETTVRQEAHSQLNLSAEHMMQGQLTPSQITAPSESTARISLNMSPAINAVMETANDKHRSTDVRGCDASFGSKVSPGLLLNQVPDKWTTLISDRGVTHSAELLETPASSRESVLSEDWFGPRFLSSEGSPASLSRTISPCSSVRSGVFTPSVIRVKRHSLAPGSSLVWNLQPCLSPASSLAPSPCPPSPGTGRAWHRPPPTQLTLLTAILRKGRLPVLSSVQQRAYSPCWPISAVSLSSCSACNAAAKLALFCPGVARSGKAQTAIAAPQREALHMLTHGPESQCLRCLTPPPSPDLFESNTFDPPVRSLSQSPQYALRQGSTNFTWQRVTSPTQERGVTSPTQQRGVTSPTQQHGFTSLTQQCRVTSPTQQHGVTSLTQQWRVTSPTQQLEVTSPTQQCGVTSPTQQHGVTSPTQQHGVTSPTQQCGVSSPTLQSTVTSSTQQCGISSPTLQSTVTSPTQQRGVTSPTQQHGFTSLTQQCRVTSPTQQHGVSYQTLQSTVISPTQQHGVTSLTQKSDAASPISPSAPVTKAAPAVQNLPFSINPQGTLPPVSNPVLSSSFLRLRSLALKNSSPSPCATGDCSAPSPVPKLSCTPVSKLSCTPEPKLSYTPEPKLSYTPEPKLTCTPVPRLTYTPEPKPTCTPEPKLFCTPEPKLSCTPEPKLSSSPVPKLSFTPEPKLTSNPVPRLTYTPEPKPTCTPEPKLFCTPEPKLSCTPEPKLSSSPVPKLSFTPEPKLTSNPVPRLTYTLEPRRDDIQSSPAPSPVPKLTFVPSPSCSEARCLSPLQTSIRMSPLSEKLCPQPPACRLSPSPWTPTLSPSPSASLCTLGLLSPLPDSHSSTPDRLSLSPSPATSSHDLLTPSPSVSPSLSPSASPVPKSDSDRAGRKRKYKIKSSYKAFAAIPTNTLLLEQQAIDDKVEKEGCPLEAEADRVTETHSEMCSPAQLRQQSEELYAAIDQVLLDPLPMHRSQSAPLPSETLEDAEVPRAIFHLQPSGSAERNLTKPGVIRPVTVIPKLTEEEEDFPNPFRQQYLEETPEEQSQKPRHPIVTVHENEALSCSEFVRTPAGQTAQLAEDRRDAGSPTFRKGDVRRTDEMVLLITEKEVTSTPPVAEGSSKLGPASFNTARVKTEVRETHI
ncbi:mucin-17 isoform X2 [Anguilla anguilla]|uniref:mucin-17 isoform X2 n=1 Tax=Anguilla anguilla TaxID=7936 RepID=UPI0015ACFD3C|nr:mucin-17 isoform X2 [Anguilla anguilla]